MYNCHSIRSLNTKREICSLKLNKNVKRDDLIKSQIIIKLTAENKKKRLNQARLNRINFYEETLSLVMDYDK